MKIVLSTFGSRGDVQPMLALTLGLQAAGHEVVLIGPPEKADWAAELGCPYQPAGSNVTALIDTMEAAHTIRAALIFTRYVHREIAVQFEVLSHMVQGADMIVAASLCFGLASMAEAMQIPYRFITFTPQLIPSGHHPFPAFRHQRLPKWCNWAGWRLVKAVDRFNLTRIVNGYRRNMGLAPVRDFLEHIMKPRVIVASDAAIAAVPSDVDIKSIQTGYMHLKQPEQHLPELEAFLTTHPVPIYVGFGSMPPKDQARLVPLIVYAARCAGRRVIISRFWKELHASEWGDDVFFIQGYPHAQLFPKMAAIVHHGGAGTTATAAISGVPQVIVPHILDQYYWGEQVWRSGLGPPPVWRSKLTVAKLCKAIRICTEKQSYRQKARLVGQEIRRADGVRRTIQAILASV